MSIIANHAIATLLGAVLAASAGTARSGETILVKGQGVRFVPEIVHAKVGDTLAFRQMQTQALESVDGMWPESQAPYRSAPDRDVDFRVREEGVYVFKSTPHWKAHMGLVLVVGDQDELAATLERFLNLANSDGEARPAKRLLLRFQETLGNP